jgi:5-oxoprolinase (ATP-hydrolysing) subunit A
VISRCPFVLYNASNLTPERSPPMPPRRVDLNADLGESFGIYTLGDDASLLPSLTSANIAAGFHAGDPSIIRRTIRLARAHGVDVGVHPSFPDLLGFGRREIRMGHEDVEDAVLYQIASIGGVAAAEGVRIRHVKPHGALYNLAVTDEGLASAIASAVKAYDRGLQLFAMPGSALARAGLSAGLTVVREGFADRAYQPNGQLVPRHVSGSVILDDGDAADQALSLALRGSAVAVDGSVVRLAIDSLCIHGDAPGAAVRAARVRQALESAGVEVRLVSRS